MASVHLRRGSRFWHALISLPEGRRIFRSTGMTEKRDALRIAEEWERLAKGRAEEPMDQVRRVTEDIVAMAVGRRVRSSMGVAEYVERWLGEQQGVVAAGTLSFYRGALEGWLRWLGPRAEQGLDRLTREDVVAWRAAELERVRPKTVAQRMKAVRAVLRAAMRDGYISTDPTDGVRAPKIDAGERKVRRPFTREEIERVLGLADGDWRLMIQLGLQTGQRLGDLVRMDWRDLDLVRGIWTLTAGKTGRRVLVPLGKGVVEGLQARGPRPAGDVFPQLVAEVERSRGYVGGLSKRFAHLLHLAGLRTHSPYGDDRKRVGSDDRREQQELSFHSLRHTARSWLEEAGQPKAVIDAYVGHSGDMGRQYTTVGMEALRAAAAVLGAAVAPRSGEKNWSG